ncbi:oxysterol-binding protein 2 [Nannizzia gypsea CBS 118893]|uniref:Oxysterol-binding protein 2 n=1 Tax=Arthroderma gypseum (strain ATCC MYA-4604 / CBS 118893) TaxID=535722 RepID=E4UX96_ARTGP|nr:oxysterol-binding protein 2 [Nannizzia gypsea CBS 118893]EFR02683.1 oxysterol-binding protein 2 [Nannizzia gypsea CBS 118893]
MAGMEELEIHSKSYLVRWINVSPEHTISWSIQPHKKSLNFGIFKHPGASGLAINSAASTYSQTTGSDINDLSKENNGPAKQADSSLLITEKLKGVGLKPIEWIGKCEADKISQGTYDVGSSEGGNYALVFDNTFSKQISKTVTFVLLTYPTSCPPRSGHQVHHTQAAAGPIGSQAPSRPSPKLSATETEAEAKARAQQRGRPGFSAAAPGSSNGPPTVTDSSASIAPSVHTGILSKRRRKRHQGYARRFFSLDFNSSTLSYYHDRNSSALRVEIWHLRALNNPEFQAWKEALEKASNQDNTVEEEDGRLKVPTLITRRHSQNKPKSQDWKTIERLVGSVSASRDKVRQLAKDTDPKYLMPTPDREGNQSPANGVRRVSQPGDGSESKEKRSFWKLKGKGDSGSNTPTQRPALSPLGPQQTPPASNEGSYFDTSSFKTAIGSGVHEDLMALLHDLNAVVSEFNTLISDRNRSRTPIALRPVHSNVTADSDSEEFFDAMDGGNISPLLTIHQDSGEEDSKSVVTAVDDDAASSSGSDVDDRDEFLRGDFKLDSSSSLFPVKSRSLVPLPMEAPPRRSRIEPPIGLPPSLISFMRKNVGKDLSTISMPVSANEPLSLLQRAAEQLEYSQLLDKAANATDALERLIYVTAFALSQFSSSRIKERTIRKPFNPMLGETYELVLPERGFRFIAEKVSHRPVQLAMQADSRDWSFIQSPRPTQKFWGKSVEIITEGKSRLTLHSSGEHFSWSAGTQFLRNIIAGEKYVEPVGEMCVLNETTGQKTIAVFKVGGMFSGRSEEVTVKAYDTHGEELPLGLQGNWTSSLQLTEHGSLTDKTIWAAGPLVDKPQKHYGLTEFAVTLNEITAVEQRKLPQTDSRLRPDQRALEEGNVDEAEDVKARLEEAQRHRRKEMEQKGETWRPRWFTQVDVDGLDNGDDIWKLRTGKDGYWEERAKGEWTGTTPIFQL